MRTRPGLPTAGRLAGWCLLLAIALSLCGCSRAFWRTQADAEVSQTITQLASLTPYNLEYFDPFTDRRSRLFDPTNPDRPPMPPDDPAAHKLMHCINSMPGYLRWSQNGTVPSVEFYDWEKYLPPREDGGIPLDMPTTVLIARLNSREYQQQLETFYLSALDVTFERFRFAAQYFDTGNVAYETFGPARPGGPSSTLAVANNLRRAQLFGGGGELVVGLANSFVWQFAGPNTQTANTLINFNLFQPLIRGAGRARVMERLTTAERTLLYNVRQMEQYRRGFYATIVTGRNPVQGPQRLGGVFGGAGLQGFTGIGGGGFGQVGTAVGGAGNVGGGGVGAGAGAAQAQGYIGLLQDIMQIRNQEANVAALRDSLAQLQDAYEAGRIDRFQVDLTRQNLYTNESQLLNAKLVFENLFDSVKITMGLPPDVDFILRDPFLDRFKLVDPDLTKIQGHVDDLVDAVRNPAKAVEMDDLRGLAGQVQGVREEIAGHLDTVAEDFRKLDENLPARRRTMRRLQDRPEFDRGDVEPSAYSVEELDGRVETLRDDHEGLLTRLEATWNEYDAFERDLPGLSAPDARQRLLTVLTDLSAQVLELTLVQARARLDAIELVPILIQPSEAMAVASAYRPDWANIRGSVIDSWRRIEFNANDLMTGLNVVFSGDLGTTGDNPINFRGTTGRLRVGLEFDTPLTRLGERNIYRQSLIDYQQARRRYMLYQDTVHQTLRSEIRQINLNQLNFELNRAAVAVAVEKVDLARLKLMQPPAPGETSTFSDTFARDLLQALNDLLQAQNDFMSVWVNYELQRIFLDLDLGTMQLDDRGIWIDPGPVDGRRLVATLVEFCEPEDLPYRANAAEDEAAIGDLNFDGGEQDNSDQPEELPPPSPHPAEQARSAEAPVEAEVATARTERAQAAGPVGRPAATAGGAVARFRLVAGEEETAAGCDRVNRVTPAGYSETAKGQNARPGGSRR